MQNFGIVFSCGAQRAPSGLKHLIIGTADPIGVKIPHMIQPSFRWGFILLGAMVALQGASICAAPIRCTSADGSPAAELAQILAKAHWRTLQAQFFCYQKSPMLTHGFASGGQLSLAHRQMRYQVDWPVPVVYILRDRKIHTKTVGKPWRRMGADQSSQVGPLMTYLTHLGRSANACARLGAISILKAPMPQPPRRDRHYLPASKTPLVGFGVVLRAKRQRHFVTQIELFVNARSGLLAALKIFSRQGTVTYWFFATRQNVKFPSSQFEPAGGA